MLPWMATVSSFYLLIKINNDFNYFLTFVELTI